MIYYTSDLHLGHANIIRFCNRPFSSVEDMDETLIQNWNRKVHQNDTVYILGDLSFRGAGEIDAQLSRLKGKKHLILGNHDPSWLKRVDLDKRFVSVSYMQEFIDGSRWVTLFHYPMLTWNHRARGSYMIFGHVHDNKTDPYMDHIQMNDHMLNACVEVNRYMPASLDELIENNNAFRAQTESLKAENVQNEHGYWEQRKDDVIVYWQCTACKKVHYLEEPRFAYYCPGCGAKMDSAPQGKGFRLKE